MNTYPLGSYSPSAADDDSEAAVCICGSEAIKTEARTHRFLFGEGDQAVELSAEVPVHTCSSCGDEFMDYRAEKLRHEAVCRHLGRLTPAEIRGILHAHDLTRAKFAELTGIGEASIARWLSGALIQQAGYDRYLRLLLINPENIHHLYGMTHGEDDGLPFIPARKVHHRFRALGDEQERLREQSRRFRLHA